MTVRQADFAGSWYPRGDQECLRIFGEFEEACHGSRGADPLRGGIVPHAGWVFSGRIAYSVVRELARRAPAADTVVLFGGHLGPRSPATVMVEGEFWTPLGQIPTDAELAQAVAEKLHLVRETPEDHTPDNTVELQAPIIRHLFPQARLVVIAAPPRADTMLLADTTVDLALALGRRMVAVGSTDLTHYGPNYGWSPRGRGPEAETWVREVNDRRFIELACQLDPTAAIEEALEHHNACCPGAAAAAIRCGHQLGAKSAELLAYATSADVRPDDSFVGYAGIVF
jgi:hypothetical protein